MGSTSGFDSDGTYLKFVSNESLGYGDQIIINGTAAQI